LFLLDEAVVYNPSHLFGFFSTFNSDAIKDVTLYKGGFPAQYGGRLSSVLDIRLNDGNRKKFAGSGGIGLIASRLTLEGPIVEDKGSFMVSGRRTYVDAITRGVNRLNEGNEGFNPIPDYFFYDLNAKANYDLGENDRVFLSGYLGRDVFNFGTGGFDIDFVWGNRTASARWNHVFSPKLFMNMTLTYSDYEYEVTNNFNNFSFTLGSEISDAGGKLDFTYAPNNAHAITFGLNTTYHQFGVGRLQAGSADASISFSAGTDLDGTQYGIYVNDDWIINEKLSLSTGLRVSAFTNDDEFFYGVEPRVALKYSANDNFSFKGSYARMNQYLHLVSNSGASLPTDIWYPSTKNVLPEASDQIAAGGTYVINDKWLISNEVFYKWLDNQIDFRDGANLFVNDNLENEFVYGKGWSYGNEFYVERTKGKVTGWVGYTLAWSWRQFEEILDGKAFPFRNDRRHDVSVVGIYEINDKWTATAAFIYSTGNAVSVPQGWFISQDVSNAPFNIVPLFTERNSYRIPAYHRADLSVVRNFTHKWGKSDLTLSVYNLYDRRNIYFIFVDNNALDLTTLEDGTVRPLETADLQNLVFSAKQVSLFPVLPSLTWNFKF
jgi:outer membrane receptor for ferrienterochelin and colicin